MALVGSQSRWPRQQHASLWWLLWKWSGTIIIPSMIYCRNCSQPGSVFIPTDSLNLINGRNTSTWALGVCRIVAKPRFTASPFLLHIPLFHFIYLSTEQNLPVCPVGFQRMKGEVWQPYQLPATTQFPLRCRLRPSDVNLYGDGSGKINSADTFKDYGKKSDASGTTDGCIYSTDVAINNRLFWHSEGENIFKPMSWKILYKPCFRLPF